jgi:hypothetical protein
MSAWSAALSMPLQQEWPVISTLEACSQQLMAAVWLTTHAPPGHSSDIIQSQQVAASQFLVGRCLLSVAEQLQSMAQDPSRWAAWSTLLKPVRGGRVLSGYQVFDEALAEIEGFACGSSHAAAYLTLHKASILLGVGGGTRPAAVSGSDEELLPELAAALGRATQAGLLSESSPTRQEWRDVLRQYRYAAHMATVGSALSQALSHKLDIADQLGRALQERQQQQEEQQEEQRMLREAVAGQYSELRAAAGALCAAVPNRFFCNNPACRSTAGVSAGLGLVRGEGVVCGGCLGLQLGDAVPPGAVAARYCSVACQREHFACHRECYHSMLGDDVEVLGRWMPQAAGDDKATPCYCWCPPAGSSC